MTEDSALQLVLIVDYIVDWARDIFRPSILRQLISLTNGKCYDEVTVAPDNDIASEREEIYNWIQATNIAQDQPEHTLPAEFETTEEHDMVSMKLPNTKLGIVRPLFATKFHFTGLHITGDNVKGLLILCGGEGSMVSGAPSQRHARDLVTMVTRWDEMLVVTGADLDDIEHAWTGEKRIGQESLNEDLETDFYAIFEYRCFMASSWDIVRELSLLAISTVAFNALKRYAAFQIRHPFVESFPRVLRRCSGSLIREAIECLRSGSSWQVLLSAISSTVLSLYPIPEIKRADFVPPVACVAFGYPSSLRVRFFIEAYIKLWTRQPSRKMERYARESGWEKETSNRSYWRTSQRETLLDQLAHNSSTCTRCSKEQQDLFLLKYWDQTHIPSPTAYDAILVASLQEDVETSQWSTVTRQQRHDWCLFVLERNPVLELDGSFAVVVEDLSQDDSVYQTIKHELQKPGKSKGIRWNLSFPYRKFTKRQRSDLGQWIKELKGQPVLDLELPNDCVYPWDVQQTLLHFFQSGLAYDAAIEAVKALRDKARQKYPNMTPRSAYSTELNHYFCDKERLQSSQTSSQPRSWLPEKLKLRGEH